MFYYKMTISTDPSNSMPLSSSNKTKHIHTLLVHPTLMIVKEKVYIGSLKTNMIMRRNEHHSDIAKRQKTTALAKYCMKNELEPLWGKN